MTTIGRLVATLAASLLGIIVMVVAATIVFFITTFVVATGAGLAGYEPSGDFVVLAASLIVVAVILTGGLVPGLGGRSSERGDDEEKDPAYA